MRVNFPGLLVEALPSGAKRYRVRVEGKPKRRIRIPVDPEHPDFANHYWAARAGQVFEPKAPTKATPRSVDWLVARYLKWLADKTEAGLGASTTLRQRRSLLTRFCEIRDPDGDRYGDCDLDLPTVAFVAARDAWIKTPAEADSLIKACRAMYRWASEHGDIGHNPAVGVAHVHKPRGGAKAWTAADLRKFRKKHPPGTTAYLWLTLSMFTACRIGDAIWLGRGCEVMIRGQRWLRWQPRKKGSAPVDMPMLPPLFNATRAAVVQGDTYLLTEFGRPFKSAQSLGNNVRMWCADAGLSGRSAHGVRKAMAELLAEAGCSQHQIMAIMAHTQAKTSEIYTKGAQRRILASDAMRAVEGLEW